MSESYNKTGAKKKTKKKKKKEEEGKGIRGGREKRESTAADGFREMCVREKREKGESSSWRRT
jgi:hypothetical protein